MKKNILLFLFLSFLTLSCQQKFKEHWDLALDRDAIIVASTVEKISLTVYCSGDWAVRVVSGDDWLTPDQTSGSGVTTIHLLFTPNAGLSRKAEVEVSSAGLTRSVTITQHPGVALPVVQFAKETLSYPAASYRVSAAFDSNIPLDYFDDAVSKVEYLEGGTDWLTDFSITKTEDPSPEEAGLPDGKRCFLNMTVKANATGLPRQAKVVLMTGSDGEETYKDSVLVVQSFYEPFITLPVESDLVSRDGADRSWRLDTNLADALDNVVAKAEYPSGVSPFLERIEIKDGFLHYSVSANAGSVRRKATITVTSRDLGGGEVNASMGLEQKMEIPIALSMEELRTRFPSGGTFYDAAGTETYVEGVVECDSDNANIDHNLQYGLTVEGYAVTDIDTSAVGITPKNPTANTIYTTENDRTNYIEEESGGYGMRLKFASPAENDFRKGDRVRIYLNKVRIIVEEDPLRYTLAELSGIDVISRGGSLPYKSRTLASLSDNDIFTTVTLSDMEFQIKRGCYANVREYDALSNPVNAELPIGGSNQVRRSKDGAANLLVDASGKGIYMLLNMNASWRWDAALKRRKQVPQGSGSVTGVIVHQAMERWGGNVGRYSIRPMAESDIVMGATSSNGFKELVEWSFTRNTWTVGRYSWNASTQDIGGYDTSGSSSDASLVQEVLNATEASGMINNTDGTARLYCENVLLYERAGTADFQYPVKPAWGYRGFNVSDGEVSTITNEVEQTFGMSAGSVIQFVVNPAGFYVWSGTTWTGGVKGIVAEFSTKGKSGSQAAVSFSIAGGTLNRTGANISWTNSHSFPVDWAVEYATSSDGVSWSNWTKATNAATGATGFELRAVPFAVSNASSYPSFHSTTTSSFYTNSDNGFGLVPYRFILPASVLGKTLVRVRLVPTSLRMAAWNPGGSNWNKGLCFRNEQITPTFELTTTNHYTSICLEDVLIQYK